MSGLEGLLVAISISDAPDRAKLGFPQREIDRAILSLCTALVRDGAEIAYGGNLDPDGYTFKIFRHLAGTYAGARETPFRHFVPEPVGREILYENLLSALREGRGIVRTEIARGDSFFTARPRQGGIQLDDQTKVCDDAELAAWFGEVPRPEKKVAYSAARRMVADRSAARVVLGGKMGILGVSSDAYQGELPGIAEEALLTLEAGKPLIPLGAFGGAARDVAISLGLMDSGAQVPRPPQNPAYALAMARITALRDRIPKDLRDRLTQVAGDDRAEQTAFAVARLISDWAPRPHKAAP